MTCDLNSGLDFALLRSSLESRSADMAVSGLGCVGVKYPVSQPVRRGNLLTESKESEKEWKDIGDSTHGTQCVQHGGQGEKEVVTPKTSLRVS